MIMELILKDRKISILGTSNRTVGVKPRGSEARVGSVPSMFSLESPMFSKTLMDEVCERNNILDALKRVVANKGSAGVDGMTVADLASYLTENWQTIKAQLLAGQYQPRPIKRVTIPKPGSKEKRKLGIPCCIDRLIQQALLQVMQRQLDPHFSNNSFGFRPGRSCHQAVKQAQDYIVSGFEIVVDIDLSNFFDGVCHDRLMSKLMLLIADKRVLKLIRRYLTAGILENGLISAPTKGVPQGSPLSPLLSNIVLDELDRELEQRELKFVRYGDDCNIYVKSPRAGRRVMESITRFIESKLRLRVNEKKSAVDTPRKRKFLGFSFTGGRHPNRRKVAPESITRFRSKIRELTRRNTGISPAKRVERLNAYLRGWKGYYRFSEARSIFRDLDSWIRRRLRSTQWKAWKVYKRRKEALLRLGVSYDQAQSTSWSTKGPWRMSNTPPVRKALNNAYFDSLGLVRLSTE
jgi:RNA-directed DNA polymerase